MLRARTRVKVLVTLVRGEKVRVQVQRVRRTCGGR